MIDDGWKTVQAELDRFTAQGRTVRVWLRDDDATDVTPALERLHRICVSAAMPVLLAVIPSAAKPGLGAWIEAHSGFTPCQHGFSHTNNAPAGTKACELGGGRPLGAIEADLREGRVRLKALFGGRLSDCLVPPWNRIDPALVPRLPALGFDRLSVFGPHGMGDIGIRRLNCDLDIIDWRQGKVGRPMDEIARKFLPLLAASRGNGHPIGLLTHHLAHDETAWSTLEEVLTRLARHPAVAFAEAATLD